MSKVSEVIAYNVQQVVLVTDTDTGDKEVASLEAVALKPSQWPHELDAILQEQTTRLDMALNPGKGIHNNGQV